MGKASWFDSRQGRDGFLFYKVSRQAVEQQPISYWMGTGGTILGVRATGREAHLSHPSSAEDNSEWSCTSSPTGLRDFVAYTETTSHFTIIFSAVITIYYIRVFPACYGSTILRNATENAAFGSKTVQIDCSPDGRISYTGHSCMSNLIVFTQQEC
jgi:hypothetical protein